MVFRSHAYPSFLILIVAFYPFLIKRLRYHSKRVAYYEVIFDWPITQHYEIHFYVFLLCIERYQTLTIKTKLFAKLRTSNRIILFINIIQNMKNDYDLNFKIMILGYILSGSVRIKMNHSSDKIFTFKLDTYTLEKQENREQTCSKQRNAQLRMKSHCFYSTKLAASH